MVYFLHSLKSRNETLFYFGLLCFVLSIIMLTLTKTTNTQVFGVNAWNKPLKFALSIGIYSWTMAWFCYYLPQFNIQLFNLVIVVSWGFEIVYIAFQASKGQLSHFNVSTSTYSILYGLMGLAATIVTLYTAYIGILFFTTPLLNLPEYYIWGIRLGIIVFVIFSLEGFVMGSTLNHSVGALNDNSNWLIIGWSKTVGDLRVSHFIGMHALQVLPMLSFYILKNTRLTVIISILYFLLAFYTLMQALQGKSINQFFKFFS